MTVRHRWALYALGVLPCWLLSCSFPKPQAEGDVGEDCKVSADCTSDPKLKVCDVEGRGTCVQCTPAQADACTGATPFCEEITCRACQAHSECASDACLPDGSCAAEAQVVYLREGGSGAGGANCTKGSPCGQLETAIEQSMTTTRPYIRVTGTIEASNEDVTGKTVTFLGSPNAALRGSQSGIGGDEPILELRGASNVTIYDLILRDGRRPGIRVEEGSSVTLHRSKVQNCVEEGVHIVNGKATIATQTEISGNGMTGGGGRRGVNLTLGEVVIERSKVADNGGGGVAVADAQKVTITNSFITRNRVNGGITATQLSTDSRIEFNTIVDNISGTGATQAGGVVCDRAGVIARNNIIFRNKGGANNTVQRLGNCDFMGSFDAQAASDTDDVLKFRSNTNPFDYHLTATSPNSVRDVANLTCTGVDYHGESRPQGGTCDLGADEVKQ